MDIKPRYEHSKYGTFMFNLCAKWTKFLVKYKWLYYVLACTWGIIMTFIGWIITLVLAIAKIFYHDRIVFNKYNWIYNVKCGPDYWGGCEMGLMFLRDHKSSNSLDEHEFGHTFQNCLFGPLFPFLVAIPSCCWYWYREIRYRKGNPVKKNYDSMWFEDSASQCGKYANEFINNTEKIEQKQ